jgi:predicted DNA-binding transcriptional regulator YafY
MKSTSVEPVVQALRLFTILRLTAARRPGRRISKQVLAEACECSTKTIQRDLRLLEAAQIPIDYDPVEHSYYLPDKGWSAPLVSLTARDALALAFLRSQIVERAAQMPFASQIESALDKVMAGLSPQLRTVMETAAVAMHVPGGLARDYSHAPFGLVLQAIRGRLTLEILYESRRSGTRDWRRVDPYRIDQREGRYLEIQAWCHKNQAVLTFALDRLHDARLTQETFELRSWSDSDEGVVGGLRGGPWVEVVVRFDPVVAQYARDKNWPFKAQFEADANGSVTMTCRVQGVDGMLRELLSWRRHAEVLGGPEMRAAMVEEVEAMSALYAASDANIVEK